jgi:hypothetical protein
MTDQTPISLFTLDDANYALARAGQLVIGTEQLDDLAEEFERLLTKALNAEVADLAASDRSNATLTVAGTSTPARVSPTSVAMARDRRSSK